MPIFTVNSELPKVVVARVGLRVNDSGLMISILTVNHEIGMNRCQSPGWRQAAASEGR